MQFKLLANSWDSLSEQERVDLFKATNYEQGTVQDLQTLGKFKVLKYSDVEIQKLDTYQVDGVPTDRLVLPTNLFGKSFGKIKSITMNESISDIVNAKIRYIITKDLVTYYTFSANNWKEVTNITSIEFNFYVFDVTNITAENVLNEGLSSAGLANISEYAWSKLYDADAEGIGIGFAFSENDIKQSTAIDALVSKVDLRGSWSVANLATDYTIKYTSNNTLQVSLLSDGDFKINYQNAV